MTLADMVLTEHERASMALVESARGSVVLEEVEVEAVEDLPEGEYRGDYWGIY